MSKSEGEAGSGRAAGRPLFVACPCCQGVASASCRVQAPPACSLHASHVQGSRDGIIQQTLADHLPSHAGVQGLRR